MIIDQLFTPKPLKEGRPEDLPGIDYDRPGDVKRKQPSDEHNPYPYSKEEDDDYFREIFRKNKAKDQGVAEGLVKGEYGRVLDALQLYYPRLSMDELNVPGYHKVVADKANVPVEYAARVINDFTRDNDPNEFDDFDDDKQGVAEGKTIASGLNDWQKKALKHDTYEIWRRPVFRQWPMHENEQNKKKALVNLPVKRVQTILAEQFIPASTILSQVRLMTLKMSARKNDHAAVLRSQRLKT